MNKQYHIQKIYLYLRYVGQNHAGQPDQISFYNIHTRERVLILLREGERKKLRYGEESLAHLNEDKRNISFTRHQLCEIITSLITIKLTTLSFGKFN